MKPKFRAWSKAEKIMSNVNKLDFYNGVIDVLSFEAIEIEKVVLMQSTGLKDKNGKEIFEGDIVKITRFLGRSDEVGGFYEYDKEFIGIVKYLEDGCFGTRFLSGITPLMAIGSEFIKILGNIYEHPELLKQTVKF